TRYSVGWERTLIEHWDGNQWSIVPSPNNSPSHNQLSAITAISPTDVWAVGYFALIEHWDGNQWSVVSAPNGSYLWGVAALSDREAWTVGYTWSCQGSPCGWRTLTEHYSDPCASPTF